MTPERWQEIDRLYHAALEVEGKERIRYLDEACGEDAELRQEVESLLDTHSRQVAIKVLPDVFAADPERLAA